MGKSLVIVESPAKAKTINKYLGNQYVVKSSIGHIRDLPTSGSASASKEPAAKRGKAAAGEGPVLTPKRRRASNWFRAWVSTRNMAGKPSTRSFRVKRRSSKSCAGSPRMLTPSISQPTWIARGSHCLAPARSHRW